MHHSFIILCAWVLDAVLGDPESLPHPVKIIGRSITALEVWGRRFFIHKKAFGICLGIFIPCSAYIVTLLSIKAAALISPLFGVCISIVLMYTCLATRCLADEGRAIVDLLSVGDMQGARQRLSRIVGRDTGQLSEKDIIRATVESVSENTVDGIISPLFYACIGGAPLAMAYKAVSTLDSMIGYKNEKYIDLGWFSARLDDAANYIPARLSIVLIALAALFINPSRALKAFATGMRDGHKSPSPNSGYAEASFAGALGIQLGGDSSYEGTVSHKPLLGIQEQEMQRSDISHAIRLLWLTSAETLILFTMADIIM
ncbi:MAG: adenosylcobinamide-phosphate synthase CbiB [Pseudomonadota bacterium]